MHIFILDNEIICHQEAQPEHPDNPRRDFRKEFVAEPQEEQPTQEEVKPRNSRRTANSQEEVKPRNSRRTANLRRS